jgi:hypothetical protein
MSFLFEPFYVGKGKGKRWKLLTHSSHTKSLMKILGSPDTFSFCFNFSDETSVIKKEIKFIKNIGRKDLGLGPLLNITDGGEGTSGHKLTKDQYQKQISNIKKSWTKERKRHYSEMFSGKNNPMYGISNSGNKNGMFGKSIGKGIPKTPKQIEGFKRGWTIEKRKKASEVKLGSKNPKATKIYEVTFPDGKKEIINCLKEFARKHKLFSNLLFRVIASQQKHHHYFTIIRLN